MGGADYIFCSLKGINLTLHGDEIKNRDTEVQ